MIKKLLRLFGIGKKQSLKQGTTTVKKTASKKSKIESTRIGEIGEYKINIQLDQLPKNCLYASDIMIPNKKSRSGYAQIDHIIISPYGIFVVETKNYKGEIKGSKSEKYWTVDRRFKMYNPLMQNYGHIKALEGLLKNESNVLYISIISFTMRCRFAIDPELRKIESNELVVYDVELSEFINRKLNRLKATTGEPLLSHEKIQQMYQAIHNVNITDPKTRSAHVAALKSVSK
ncbi:nuclease-related domain-containing protein [Paenibacillus agilis]|uniref:NERD domain-containing protein n=1 Tax=Paenibacillus agilis TaxID=3020863 RepID=A0A559J168_9BACL|nr:nuclease-related domain-containing protein [Paenibacillus agilis]TVX93622.1 NERD domain-containing protein [Paenibacillus agilis]